MRVEDATQGPGILADIEADLERAPELIAEEGVEIEESAPQPAMA